MTDHPPQYPTVRESPSPRRLSAALARLQSEHTTLLAEHEALLVQVALEPTVRDRLANALSSLAQVREQYRDARADLMAVSEHRASLAAENHALRGRYAMVERILQRRLYLELAQELKTRANASTHPELTDALLALEIEFRQRAYDPVFPNTPDVS